MPPEPETSHRNVKGGLAPPLLLALALGLAGCAAGSREAPVTAAAPASFAASPDMVGTVAAVREVDSTSGDGSRAGIDAVLAALGQPVSSGPVSSGPVSSGPVALREIVVARPDGSAVSLGGRYPGFAVGNHVTIAAGQTTNLLHGG